MTRLPHAYPRLLPRSHPQSFEGKKGADSEQLQVGGAPAPEHPGCRFLQPVVENSYLANGGEVLSVHANSQKPWIARFYNDSYSATTPIFAYFGYDNGNFSMGTYGARDLGLFVGNHYGSEELVIKGSTGNVGIGITSPNAAALLHLSSTNKGFLPPVMTTAQKTAITSPPAGLVVYDSTLNKLCVYTGSSWETITSS